MPLLDVTEILFDPDFASGLKYIRQAQTISSGGIASNTQVTKSFTGVVCSVNGSVLNRLADGERVVDSMQVHTTTVLIDGRPGFTADIVLWQGRQWTVTSINDYNQYGRGHLVATCEIIPLAG